MNLVYTTDNNFVPQVAAGMCSVMENNQDAQEIHFYLIGERITPENREKLNDFVAARGRKLTVIELDEIASYFDFEFDTLGWRPVILARLLLDRLLPPDVDRVLYLDGDTIVRGNLAELWQTDMGDAVIGACVEPTMDKQRKIALGMENVPYFNSGVLLIDLDKWRKQCTGQRIIQFYEEKGGRLFAPDQDAINGALKGEIHILSPKYNFYNIYTCYPYRTLCKMMKPVPYVSRSVYDDAMAHPTIIHYLGEERPWREGNRHTFRADFDRYLAQTPWADMPREQGWKGYFFCFYLFNTLTKPFPMLRYKIINALIPAFMRHRARQIQKSK